MTELMEQLRIDAAQRPVSGEQESDDNLVRLWQDELREAREKLEVYRSDASASRAFGADVRHTQAVLESLPARIATRRAEIAYEQWAQETLAGLAEIPVSSMDRSFASIRKEYLTVLAPELAIAIPKKSHLWTDWSVWNFKRHRLDRAKARPAEAASCRAGHSDGGLPPEISVIHPWVGRGYSCMGERSVKVKIRTGFPQF